MRADPKQSGEEAVKSLTCLRLGSLIGTLIIQSPGLPSCLLKVCSIPPVAASSQHFLSLILCWGFRDRQAPNWPTRGSDMPLSPPSHSTPTVFCSRLQDPFLRKAAVTYLRLKSSQLWLLSCPLSGKCPPCSPSLRLFLQTASFPYCLYKAQITLFSPPGSLSG